MPTVTTDHIIIKLPISLPTVCKLMMLVEQQWPGSMVLTDHDHGDDHMVIRITETDR